MKIEDRIRMHAHNKVRVHITKRKRSGRGFTVTAPDGTAAHFPTKRIALQFLLAIVRCQRQLEYSIRCRYWRQP